MKILHLNTHSYGGAAMVARRLHLAALADGIDSSFITKYGLRSDATPGYRPLRDARLLYSLRKRSEDPRLYKIGKLVQRGMQHRNLVNRPAGYEIFSPVNSRPQFADCAQPDDPNVVHLHWVAGFVDHAEFFRKNRHRKFVWTLHDMNPFTGGCHHSDGCTSFEQGCTVCPQLAGTVDAGYARQVFDAKRHVLESLSDDQLVVVAPSRWILEQSARSSLLRRFRHIHIGNPSIGVRPAIDQQALRTRLGLPRDKKIIAFVADNLRAPRKGVSLLFEAVRALPEREQIVLVGIGQRTDAPAGTDVRFVGTIKDEEKLAEYFSAADLLVHPSAAENAPLVVIEALTCGTPVLAFPVGGIPELIDEQSGALVTHRSVEALGAAVRDALFAKQFDRAAIREQGAQHQPAAVLERYKAVYRELAAAS